MSTLGLAVAYVLGGLTFLPALLLLAYISHTAHALLNRTRSPHPLPPAGAGGAADEAVSKSSPLSYKVGWLRVSRDEQRLPPPDASIGDMVRSYIIASNKEAEQNKKSSIYFAVLKQHTLYLYDSERQLDCQGVIQVDQHSVTMHPPGLKDPELFTRPHLIKLTHARLADHHYFINCNRCIDKEDWYLALRHAASSAVASHDVDQQTALRHLITTIHSSEHHFQTQWFNAMLGRIFCGVYKTDTIRAFLYNKLISKLDKINARRPPFLGEITVRSVHPGHAQPYITQPRLLSLTPAGELTAEAHMHYEGGIRFEIETVLQWRYSDHLRPLRIDLVLAITLRALHGRFQLKIKEPPTNRFWYGFHELPKMEWGVEPLVWERRVGYSVVVRAIQSKIDELVMENIVLPNMDDITFFPTDDAAGGIFMSATPPSSDSSKPRLRRAATTKETVTVTPPVAPSSPKQRPLMSGSVSEGTRQQQQQRTGSLIGTILKHKTSFDALSTSPLGGSSFSSSSSTASSIASSSTSSSSYQHHHHPPSAIHSESDLSEGIRLRKSASLARLKSKSLASTAVSQINVSPTMHHDLIDPGNSKKITSTTTTSEATTAIIKSSQSAVTIAS